MVSECMVGNPEVMCQFLVNGVTGQVEFEHGTCPVRRLTRHYLRVDHQNEAAGM
jgi:hypothetical protein